MMALASRERSCQTTHANGTRAVGVTRVSGLIAICSVPTCDRPRKTRGWCHAHYMRWWVHGDVLAEIPLDHKRSRATLAERLWRLIRRDPGTGCWFWVGNTNPRSGYGQFTIKGKGQVAHRVVYELIVGPIPAGHVLDHLCRVRRCVNPSHLEPVTQSVNVLRGDHPMARRARGEGCPTCGCTCGSGA